MGLGEKGHQEQGPPSHPAKGPVCEHGWSLSVLTLTARLTCVRQLLRCDVPPSAHIVLLRWKSLCTARVKGLQVIWKASAREIRHFSLFIDGSYHLTM